MAGRQISEQEIDEVLAHPEASYPSESRDDRLVVLGRTMANPPRRLKVVVLVDDPEYVITVADRDVED